MSADWVLDVGQLAAAVSAVIACLGLIARSRLGVWLAHSITEDLRERRRAEFEVLLEPIRHEITPNGGGSMRDEIREIRKCQADGRRSQERTHELLLTHLANHGGSNA